MTNAVRNSEYRPAEWERPEVRRLADILLAGRLGTARFTFKELLNWTVEHTNGPGSREMKDLAVDRTALEFAESLLESIEPIVARAREP